MLRALAGAFSRPQWLRILRAELLPQFYPQLVTSIYGTRHGTTHSFRHTHLLADQSESTENSDRDFPVDILDGQSTLRDISGLLEEGKYSEASKAMGDIIQTQLSQKRSLDLFQRLRKLLLSSPEANITLLTQLGVAYASKGHKMLVQKEIEPLIGQFATSEVLSKFQVDLEIASAQFKPSPDNNTLFEDNSEAYADVASGSLPPPTSILEILKQKLPDLLPEHSPDDAIFEAQGPEYSAVTSTLSRHSPNSSIRALVQLVELRDFNQAYLLLKDIQDLDIHIPLSFVYEAPAQAALRNSDLHAAKQVEQFTAWFSLIPPNHASDTIRTFDETCRLIFQAKIVNLSLVFNFARIMASKGYGQTISVQAIPIIIRCSSFEIALNFLDDFNDAHAKYWSIHDPKVAVKKTERLASGVRGLALRTLAYSDRIDEALSLLPDPKDTHFKLTSFTYDVLLRRLEKSKNVEHREQIPMVEELRNQGSTVSENNSVSPLTILAEETEMASNLNPAPPVDLSGNLVNDLRHLKLAFLHEGLVVHPFTIVNFMNMYLATGRTRALELLYNRAIRTSYRVTSTFIFAEMLFYRRLRQYDLVIETFVDHFYLTGVPREYVLNRYHRLSAMRRAFDPATREDPPPQRCYKYDVHKALPRGKLWPLSIHCNLVYHALAAVTTPTTELETLYQKLLLIVEHGKDAPTTPAIASVEPLVTGSKGRPSSGAFTPFFRRLMQTFGAARGAKILNDMAKVGIRPTIYHFTELAGFYASSGDAQRAFLILDSLERRLKDASESSTVGLDDQGDSSTSEPHNSLENLESSTLPAPDLVMYISLMRGFIISKNLQAADDVASRLRQLHKHRKGEDKYLDDVYRDLEDMREVYNHQVGSVNAALERRRTRR